MLLISKVGNFSLNKTATFDLLFEVYWNSTIRYLKDSPSIYRVVLNLNVELNYEIVWLLLVIVGVDYETDK